MSKVFWTASLRTATTASFGALDGAGAVSPATTNIPSRVVIFPERRLPSLSVRFRFCDDSMPRRASHLMVPSPAKSVLITRVLPSPDTMLPLRRSPFFKLTWSASAAEAKNSNNVMENKLRRISVLLDYLENIGSSGLYWFRLIFRGRAELARPWMALGQAYEFRELKR